MKKTILLFMLLLMCASPVLALTGRVLLIVVDQPGAAVNVGAYKGNHKIFRCADVQGWKYETCMASDSAFVNSLYATDPIIGGVGSRYGRYDMAVMLNMPNPAWLDTDAKCATYNMTHFAQWVDRSSARKFPIPLVIPLSNVGMTVTNALAKAYTGALSVATLTSAKGEPYKDAQGDSLYLLTPTSKSETLVAENDSTGYSFSYPLMWRHTAGRASLNAKQAAMWMTVGTGSHRVIWIPNVDVDWQTGNLLTAFAMFTKATPIEMPVLAYAFGKSTLASIEAGTDTVQYGAGFKRNVDYAVANGIKLELLCVPYYMQSENVTANKTQAIAYQTAHPDNIRLTISSMYGWGPYAEDLSIVGSTGSYSQKVKRLQQVQDSCGVYFPTLDTDRLDIYAGRFIDPTTGKADSTLAVLAARDITDLYMDGSATWAQYPNSTIYGILGSQRTWVGAKEMRFHPIGYTYMRYTLQQVNNPDWLKTAYVDTAGTNVATSSVRRATMNSLYLPYCIGLYKNVAGSITGTSDGTATIANRVAAQSTYQVGMYLPAMTFCGGSKLTWKNADHTASVTTRRAQVDSTRSVFLDTMKQLNAQKKMSDYIVDTYGTTGNRTFIWSWLSDVNWDRKNGRPFANSNVKKE